MCICRNIYIFKHANLLVFSGQFLQKREALSKNYNFMILKVT